MARKSQKIVAEICLYGNSSIGAGWLATTADGRMLGNGEPVAGRSMTGAVHLAAEAIREASTLAYYRKVHIYAPGGERMAVTDLSHPVRYGDLDWRPALPALVITIA